MTAPVADEAVRRRVREDLDATLLVEAAAGTGKTTVLVARILAVLRSGRATLGQMIAVTFTEKAAGEMKLRLRSALEEARLSADVIAEERARLEAALAELEIARIGTIHSLCSDLLRERPVEAGVDPLFEVAATEESTALLDEAFSAWFQGVLRDPPEGVRRLLRRRPRGRDARTPRQELRDAAWRRIEHRDFDCPWRREPFERGPAIDVLVKKIAELGVLARRAQKQSNLVKNLAELDRFAQDLAHREAVSARDYDGLEAALRDLARDRSWTWKGYGDQVAPGLSRSEVLARRDALKAELDAFIQRSEADLAACLHAELAPVLDGYAAVKSRLGKLDFFDLLLQVRDLLRDRPAVRGELQRRFTHLFVDEFQDTDPLQAEILLLLSADDPRQADPWEVTPLPGKLFLVGDPKQSIYRFRRADVALYEDIKQRLVAKGAHVVYLTTSFRSQPALQQAVNAAFSRRMGEGTATQARYVPLQPSRDAFDDQPALVALPVPRPYGDYGTITKFRIEDSVPDAVGAFIEYLVTKSGWTIFDPELETRVPIQPRHICILFKRFQAFSNDITRAYTRALEARRVPHVLVGGRSFHAREEVLAIRNALTAVEWPDDELAVFATLRGPLFALGDDALLAFRGAFGKLHPLRPLELEGVSPAVVEVADALAVLRRLHRGRNRRPLAGTLERLLEATRAHAGLAFWSAGEQALANVLRMLDLARRFESGGATSFRAFVEQLWDDAERGEASEAPIVEEGSEGVRIMTVHRAKGLEFPVVVLADPTANAVPKEPTRYDEPRRRLWAEPLAGCAPVELLEHRDDALRRDADESVRLTYVAATRARDLLVVPAVADAPQDGWVDVLHPVLYPRRDQRRSPRAAPGCPAFGAHAIVDRPENAQFDPELSVAPGLHTPEAGEHPVVWWDPRTLSLDRPADAGLRPDEVLRDDGGSGIAEAARGAYEAWRTRRDTSVATASRPTVDLRAAHDAELPGGPPVDIERTDAPREGRPRGRRFGTLVHAVLARVPLTAAEDVIASAARWEARRLGATDAEARSASEAVAAALRHPLLQRARTANQCRRESPILLRGSDGSVTEGAVDLAFREPENGAAVWTVVDFKTDADIEAARDGYAAQLAAYVEAIREATGDSARGVLLSV